MKTKDVLEFEVRTGGAPIRCPDIGDACGWLWRTQACDFEHAMKVYGDFQSGVAVHRYRFPNGVELIALAKSTNRGAVTKWQIGAGPPEEWPLGEGEHATSYRGRTSQYYHVSGRGSEDGAEHYFRDGPKGVLEVFAYRSRGHCGWQLRIEGISGCFEFCRVAGPNEMP